MPTRLRSVVSLLSGDGRRRAKAAEALGLRPGERAVLAEGPHLVREAAQAAVRVLAVVGTAAALAGEAREDVAALGARGAFVHTVPEREMERLSRTRSPQGIVAVAVLSPPLELEDIETRMGQENALVLGLDGVQDPGNVGSLARTALAAGTACLVLGAATARPDDPKTLRASQGGLFRLPHGRTDLTALCGAARRAGATVVAAVPRGGRAPWEIDLSRPTLLLLGGEGAGLRASLADDADARLTLPMVNGESLGVAAAGAAILYERLRQVSG